MSDAQSIFMLIGLIAIIAIPIVQSTAKEKAEREILDKISRQRKAIEEAFEEDLNSYIQYHEPQKAFDLLETRYRSDIEWKIFSQSEYDSKKYFNILLNLYTMYTAKHTFYENFKFTKNLISNNTFFRDHGGTVPSELDFECISQPDREIIKEFETKTLKFSNILAENIISNRYSCEYNNIADLYIALDFVVKNAHWSSIFIKLIENYEGYIFNYFVFECSCIGFNIDKNIIDIFTLHRYMTNKINGI